MTEVSLGSVQIYNSNINIEIERLSLVNLLIGKHSSILLDIVKYLFSLDLKYLNPEIKTLLSADTVLKSLFYIGKEGHRLTRIFNYDDAESVGRFNYENAKSVNSFNIFSDDVFSENRNAKKPRGLTNIFVTAFDFDAQFKTELVDLEKTNFCLSDSHITYEVDGVLKLHPLTVDQQIKSFTYKITDQTVTKFFKDLGVI